MTATAPDLSEAEEASEPATGWARNIETMLGAGAVVLFLLFWELSVNFGLVKPLFTSSPTRIITTGAAMFADGTIFTHLGVSGLEFVLGFSLAIVVGVPLGILMGWYRLLNAVLDPFVSALYATPRIALLPLIVIWFGIGIGSKIAIIFLSSVFPILINTITGVRTVERDFVKVARSFSATDRQLFATVVLPSSVPMLLTGVRLGLGHALIGVVVGELYAATAGIGFLIAVAGASFQTDRVMVGIIIISAAGMALTSLLKLIERRFEPWRTDNRA